LIGEQGIGKSTIFKKLGKEWFSDSLAKMEGKEAYEALQGWWIIETPELTGMKKSDVENIKHFLAKQSDTFRPAYGRFTVTFNRQCVIVGTTNTKNFLKDKTGNRRFLPLDTNKENVEKTIDRLQAQLNMSKMKSPINGTVDEVKVRLGEMASPGTPYSGIRVINTNKLSVKAKLSDTYLSKVKKGDKVQIVFPDIDKTIESQLTFVGNVVNAQNRSFTIESQLNNSGGDFAANMIAKMMINDINIKDAITVPTNIIQKSLDGTFVLLVEAENGKQIAKKRMITIGLEYNGVTQILSGLNVGDNYISFGYSEINEGQMVTF
jgi:multidrug efflux pump subunit AcrA (membrane-fusion protein)